MQSQRNGLYDAQWVAEHFDSLGVDEWHRLTKSPVAEVSLHIHTHYLREYLSSSDRVLEVGAGAGRFTQILAEIGCRILVADISSGQLDLNRRHADEYGFANAVEDWLELDICQMDSLRDSEFDAVVAYGGPLSYVLDKRDAALDECLRVLRPEGRLLLSVMSLWGSAHSRLLGVLDVPPAANRRITNTGDLLPGAFDGAKHFAHMFRAGELRRWLTGVGLEILSMSASGCLSLCWNKGLEEVRQDAATWGELLRMELEVSSEAESLNMGTHLIAVAQKPCEIPCS